MVHYWVSAGRELNFVAPVPESSCGPRSVRWLTCSRPCPNFAEPARRISGGAETLMRFALYDRDPLTTWERAG
jgi:hypothetical protein